MKGYGTASFGKENVAGAVILIFRLDSTYISRIFSVMGGKLLRSSWKEFLEYRYSYFE